MIGIENIAAQNLLSYGTSNDFHSAAQQPEGPEWLPTEAAHF